jgi:hypothetical protein
MGMIVKKPVGLNKGYVLAPYIIVDKIDIDVKGKDTSKWMQTVASRYASISIIQRIDKIKKILKDIEDLKQKETENKDSTL